MLQAHTSDATVDSSALIKATSGYVEFTGVMHSKLRVLNYIALDNSLFLVDFSQISIVIITLCICDFFSLFISIIYTVFIRFFPYFINEL